MTFDGSAILVSDPPVVVAAVCYPRGQGVNDMVTAFVRDLADFVEKPHRWARSVGAGWTTASATVARSIKSRWLSMSNAARLIQ